jgi:hypothetical protein
MIYMNGEGLPESGNHAEGNQLQDEIERSQYRQLLEEFRVMTPGKFTSILIHLR